MPKDERWAVVPTEEFAEHMCLRLRDWFGGTWYHKIDHDGYALHVRNLEDFRAEKAKYYTIGFLAGIEHAKQGELERSLFYR